MSYIEQATQFAQSKGLATHLDGARLFNAAVAQAVQRGTNARKEAKAIADKTVSSPCVKA